MSATTATVIQIPHAMRVLLLVQGSEQQKILLESMPFVIGRKSGSQLLLADPHVSREHAIIIEEMGAFYLVDQGSKHGTYVNGEPIARHRLKNNDRLEFGATGGACLIFNPDKPLSSTARDFLNQVVALPAQGAKSDLEMLTFFLEAARKLNTAGVLKDVLLTLIDTTLKLTHAERGYVFLRGRDGELRMAAAQNMKGVPLVDDGTISRSLLEEAASSTSEFLVQDATQTSQFANRGSIIANELRTIICIPLRKLKMRERKESAVTSMEALAASQTAGVLYLDSRFVTSSVSTTDTDILRAIATEAAALLENANLVQAEEESRKLQQELNIASAIQQRLMTVSIPELGFAAVQARNIPCKDIGGDFFDVVMTRNGLAVIIADVCGKGVSAALLASILQGMIYSQLANNVPLTEIVTAANEFLCKKNLDAKYATLVLSRLNSAGTLEYVNCGHVPPLLIKNGALERTEPGNVPVGLIPDAIFQSASLKLNRGDRFILLTDGITEAANSAGEFFGDERLHSLATAESPIEHLLQCVSQFCGDHPFDDDCTVVDLLYKG